MMHKEARKIQIIRKLSIKGTNVVELRTYKIDNKKVSKYFIKSFGKFVLDEKNRSRFSKMPIFTEKHFSVLQNAIRINNYKNN